MPQSEQDVLVERLSRYPVTRYPVQHATTQFHLGAVLLHVGDTAAAAEALAASRVVFTRSGMLLEAAKATVMLGVAHRAQGRLEAAAAAFAAAGDALAGLDAPAERGAAVYNLGLVRLDNGDRAGACEAWTTAREVLLAAGQPAQAAAAARDHGACLLAEGSVQEALPLLEQAAALAERAGDDPGTAAAGNALGLAHLGGGDAASAVQVLRRALGFAPRAVRPREHAMVKANLALAHEQAGNAPRARLCAAQALAVPSAAPLVRAQAQALLARVTGSADQDLRAVLDAEGQHEWAPAVREEALRTAGLPEQRRAMVRALLDGVLADPCSAHARAQVLWEVLLELPPRLYDDLVEGVVGGCTGRPEQDEERLRAVLSSALARFPIPQWQRLVASLNAAAARADNPAAWR